MKNRIHLQYLIMLEEEACLATFVLYLCVCVCVCVCVVCVCVSVCVCARAYNVCATARIYWRKSTGKPYGEIESDTLIQEHAWQERDTETNMHEGEGGWGSEGGWTESESECV